MGIISLITDFGLKDNFVGVIKAVILRINPAAEIVDICHEIPSQDIWQAAFLLRSSFRYFPPQTVHLAVVDPGVGSERKKILVKTKNYFFIAPDNGILALILQDEPPLDIFEITNQKYFLKPVSNTFHGRDIFAPVAAYLSKKEELSSFGRRIKSFKDLSLPEIKRESKNLIGEVIYIDRFGNLITNIDKNTLYNFIQNKKFQICVKDIKINKLSNNYAQALYRNPLALINSFNYLEVAISGGSACNYLGIDRGAKVSVRIVRHSQSP